MPPLSSDIEYAESGSGPALLFMPGAFSTGAASRGVIEHLGEGYRVITTSLLGYGATAERRPAGNRTMAQQVEVLEATIAHIGAPVHVIGHSYGGASVITHAISGALKPASLVLVEAPLADILRATGDQEHHEMFGAAVTLNERLDYFGQTVNIAARVQNLADGDEICITEEVYGAPAVAEIIAPYPVVTSEAELKGISKAMSVYHLARMA